MKTNTNNDQTQVLALEAQDNLNEDFKHAVLIVSLLANLFILIGWVTLQVTSIYDYEVTLFLFYR